MNSKYKNELWFGIYGRQYKGIEPAFFDETELSSWVEVLKENYPLIQKELAPLMLGKNKDMVPYFGEDLQFPPKNWKTIGLCFWGKKVHENMKRFPVLASLFDKIPSLITVSFNLLEPHSRIKPHFGETNGVFRVHLGIKIPAGLPQCGFVVNGEARAWQEGELLVFLDANTHEAFNHTDEQRYILLMDIMRPEFESRKKWICVKALSILSFYYINAYTHLFTSVLTLERLGKTPHWLIDLILFPVQAIWWFWLPLQNWLDFKKPWRWIRDFLSRTLSR